MTESSQSVRFSLLLRLGGARGGKPLSSLKAAEGRRSPPKPAEGRRSPPKALIVIFVLFSSMAMVFVGRIASLSFFVLFSVMAMVFVGRIASALGGGLVFAECLIEFA